jgi:hypothetical protein
MAKCGICKRELDVVGDETTLDCGGDCLRCMAEAGDPECRMHMLELKLPFKDNFPKELPVSFTDWRKAGT